MAGDRKSYEKAMREGLNLAWEGKWNKAVAAYKRAIEEVNDDAEVYNHLGWAYLEQQQIEEALGAYTQASKLAPDDPGPLARIADIHECLGKPHAAADALWSMAELYARRHEWKQAIQGFQRVSQIQPDHLRAILSLAEVYVTLEQPQRAAREYLNLARILHRQGQLEKALDQCRIAIDLDPRNAEARALAEGLHMGTASGLTMVDDVEAAGAAQLPAEDGASPVDMARDRALEELAGIPFEEIQLGPAAAMADFQEGVKEGTAAAKPALSRPQIDALVAQAIDFQTRGLVDEAISCYTRVIDAGVDRPAAHFNLGLLYQQRLRFEPAIGEFKQAVRHHEYELGSHFALGECFKALGRLDEALEHFVQALKIVDLGTVQREQADDLINLYDALADSYIAKGDRDKALTFANSLIEFLSSKGWEDKARAARQRLDSMSEEGVTMSLAEILAAPSAETILSSMTLSQEYVRRGALTAATEVCYRAIQSAPTYLPLHLRLAEIFAQDGRVEDAVTKYQTVADLYLVREEKRQAIGVYKRILRLMPMDVVVRSRLIDLLISSGEIDQTLDQYLSLADAYYHLAQVNKALEKYAEALRLVPRASEEQEWRVRLLRKMADIQMRRASWHEAADIYRQLVVAAPEDERARVNLIDLYYKLGRTKEADRETVAMVAYYGTQGEGERSLALLQEMVRLQPQQMALRARLARAYIDAGQREEAIRELDVLGEMQLDAGLREQAMATVRYIISLKPKNVEAYRQLLDQL
ncbi:MAG: tetratricopeptide repeat protein [Anaerolineae bacterium]|nr:tetratricopeptide repeat protein [Anaerolineae bacterium]